MTPFVNTDLENIYDELDLIRVQIAQINGNQDIGNANGLVLKATPVQLSAGDSFTKFLGGYILNPNAVNVWVKFYNQVASNVTVGTTTPFYKVQIPANGQLFLDSPTPYCAIEYSEPGFEGVSIAATTGYLNSSIAAPGLDLEYNLNFRLA